MPLSDRCSFRHNEHHITSQQGAKLVISPQLPQYEVKSYNLRPNKITKHLHWPDIPAKGMDGSQIVYIRC